MLKSKHLSSKEWRGSEFYQKPRGQAKSLGCSTSVGLGVPPNENAPRRQIVPLVDVGETSSRCKHEPEGAALALEAWKAPSTVSWY